MSEPYWVCQSCSKANPKHRTDCSDCGQPKIVDVPPNPTPIPWVTRATGRTIPDLTGREHVCKYQDVVRPALSSSDAPRIAALEQRCETLTRERDEALEAATSFRLLESKRSNDAAQAISARDAAISREAGVREACEWYADAKLYDHIGNISGFGTGPIRILLDRGEKARAALSTPGASLPSVMAEAVRPEIVCLCGSTRFYEAFQRANYELTMAGKIVLSVGFYPHQPKAVSLGEAIRTQYATLTDMLSQPIHNETVGCTTEQKTALDELHKRKIDLADRVFVLNVGGYIGSSTRSEIEYATRLNKPIEYLEQHADSLDAGERQEGEKS